MSIRAESASADEFEAIGKSVAFVFVRFYSPLLFKDFQERYATTKQAVTIPQLT